MFWHGAGTFHGFDFAREWAAHFHILLPYHPGFGESDPAPQFDAMAAYLDHYLALLDKLGLEQVDLIGLSLGGWMAAEFAAAHGERLRRLVLVAPAGLEDPDHPTLDLAAIPPEDILSCLAHDVSVFDPHLPRDQDEVAALQRLQARERESMARLAPQGPVAPGLERRLESISVPTLLVWGREDRLTPVGKADRWLRHLPEARLALFEQAGHMVLDEAPDAPRAVVDFLSG
jgi:pimeloyl-ACP methyl ester carboxylesterase